MWDQVIGRRSQAQIAGCRRARPAPLRSTLTENAGNQVRINGPSQNRTRRTNCRMRGSRAPFTVPKPFLLLMVPFAFKYKLVNEPPVSAEIFSVELIPENCV